MKNWICNVLIGAVRRLDPIMLSKCTLSNKISLEYKSLIPNDGKWHHVAISHSMWVMAGKERLIKSKVEQNLAIDGVLQKEKKCKSSRVSGAQEKQHDLSS